MRHRATASFWQEYNALDADLRKLADRSFEILKKDAQHPSLRLKKAAASGRLGSGFIIAHFQWGFRAGLLWFWVGDHDRYDRLVGQIRFP